MSRCFHVFLCNDGVSHCEEMPDLCIVTFWLHSPLCHFEICTLAFDTAVWEAENKALKSLKQWIIPLLELLYFITLQIHRQLLQCLHCCFVFFSVSKAHLEGPCPCLLLSAFKKNHMRHKRRNMEYFLQQIMAISFRSIRRSCSCDPVFTFDKLSPNTTSQRAKTTLEKRGFLSLRHLTTGTQPCVLPENLSTFCSHIIITLRVVQHSDKIKKAWRHRPSRKPLFLEESGGVKVKFGPGELILIGTYDHLQLGANDSAIVRWSNSPINTPRGKLMSSMEIVNVTNNHTDAY